MPAKASTHEFRAETRKVLNILTHSLYTNREIFLRELLSNASDALDKLRYLQSKGEDLRDADLPLEIVIRSDKDKGLLLISDSGVGMTKQELIDNLGTIAKSGSEQFLKDMTEGKTPEEAPQEGKDEGKDEGGSTEPDSTQIIGRFGIGFYSVFMVADEVEVVSVPARGDEGAYAWSSTGAGSFSIRKLPADEAAEYKRGTTVRARLKEDAKEFLEKYRLESVIRTHSNFLPFPILVEGERVNTTEALWREPKFSITQEQYAEFYKYLSYDGKPPLDVLHLSVDAPVQFTALMFIPDSPQDYFGEQRDQWGLDLYVRRVLIEKSNSDLIPNYLAFLKGVVDTEDLPLNISRETLQENVVLRKIAQTILKQVFTHLERMAETDKEKYQRFWNLHGKYFKFAFQDYLNRDKVAPLLRFLSSATEGDALTSLDDYVSRAKAGQKEIWYVAAPSREAAKVNPHMERFRRKGLEVLCLLEPVDEFALENLREYKDMKFKAVEQAGNKDLEEFPDTEETPQAAPLSDGDKEDFDALLARMKEILGDRVTEVRVSDRLTGSPAALASPDGISSSMEKIMRVMQKNEDVPKKVLEVNQDHSLLRALLRIYKADRDNPLLADMTQTLFDNLLLMEGYIPDPYRMADRALRLMDASAAWYADMRKL